MASQGLIVFFLLATLLSSIKPNDLGVIQGVAGYASYRAKIPNGDNVVRNGVPWPGVGHNVAAGGGSRNPFGAQFRSVAQLVWTKEFCEMDSDGDGQSNGLELGDPLCEWTEASGATPYRTTEISHPGFADSTTPACAPFCTPDSSNANSGSSGTSTEVVSDESSSSSSLTTTTTTTTPTSAITSTTINSGTTTSTMVLSTSMTPAASTTTSTTVSGTTTSTATMSPSTPSPTTHHQGKQDKSAPHNKSLGGLSPTYIGAIAGGVVVLLVIILILVFCCRKNGTGSNSSGGNYVVKGGEPQELSGPMAAGASAAGYGEETDSGLLANEREIPGGRATEGDQGNMFSETPRSPRPPPLPVQQVNSTNNAASSTTSFAGGAGSSNPATSQQSLSGGKMSRRAFQDEDGYSPFDMDSNRGPDRRRQSEKY